MTSQLKTLTALAIWLLVGSTTPTSSASDGTGVRPITREFRDWTFSLEVPSGYNDEFSESPYPFFTMIAFASKPREDKDGTTAMVQVSLIDLKARGAEGISLESLGLGMIQGVEKRRKNFKVSVTDGKIGSTKVKRYEWEGTSYASGRGMKGVMFVGIEAGAGFSLSTQDLDYAKEALVLGENSLRTFRLRLSKSN